MAGGSSILHRSDARSHTERDVLEDQAALGLSTVFHEHRDASHPQEHFDDEDDYAVVLGSILRVIIVLRHVLERLLEPGRHGSHQSAKPEVTDQAVSGGRNLCGGRRGTVMCT